LWVTIVTSGKKSLTTGQKTKKMYTLCLKKRPHCILNNLTKNEPILIIFGVKEISHQKIVNSPT